MLRWLLDHDCWEYVTKLHLAVAALLAVAVVTATIAIYLTPTKWIGITSLLLAAAGTYQTRIADDYQRDQEHFWDEKKFPNGPPSYWMRNMTMDEGSSLRARLHRQLFRNPSVGIGLIALSTAAGITAWLV